MLVYKMNQLLLLAGLVIVLYIMNEKKMFKDVSKTLSSGKNNTMLVLVFCGVILFMCMQKDKVMEYFTPQSLFESNMCPSPLKSHSVQVVSGDAYAPVQVCVTEEDEKILTSKGLLKDEEEESLSAEGAVGGQEGQAQQQQDQPQDQQQQDQQQQDQQQQQQLQDKDMV